MSDGQFSSKPIRSGRSREAAITVGAPAGNFSADAASAFLNSPAVQREVNALIDQRFPPVGELNCAPLNRKTPAKAMDLGRPIASATLVQEYLIGLLFLRFWGWVFLICGTLILISAIGLFLGSVLRANAQPGEPGLLAVMMTAGIGLAIAGAGAWFGIVRGRVVTEMCWFCPRGMIWITDGLFEWYTWEEVPEVYCKLQATRPAIGICFEDEIGWISFSNTGASRQVLAYIEKQASAACVPTTIRLIAQGSTVRFGGWRLSQASIRDADADFAWRDVIGVDGDEVELCIRHREQGRMIIPLDQVPFPSLFTALVRAIHAHVRR